jgi:hypothetical protein
MKRRKLNLRTVVLVLFTGITISSCSKDEKVTEDLLGNWTTVTSTFNVKVGSQSMLNYFINDLGYDAWDAGDANALFLDPHKQDFIGSLTIKSDHKYTSNFGGTVDSGTWSLDSDREKLTLDSVSDDPITIDILNVSSYNLHLIMTKEVNMDLNSDEILEEIVIEANTNFSK